MEEDLEYVPGDGAEDSEDPLAFTTVEDDLDEVEAESSFKELLDWMRYLAQHQGQRRRLIDLLSVATDSLRDLSGIPGPQLLLGLLPSSNPVGIFSWRRRPARRTAPGDYGDDDA
jgi:hypothetical protein